MQRLSTEIKVGVFVIVGIIILTFLTFRIGDFTLGREKGYVIYGLFDTVAGLEVKSQVKMAGVRIGTVETIGLEGSRASIGMRLGEGVRIRKGAAAAIKTASLLGEKYVEIIQGEEEEFIKEGGTIEKSIAVADMDSLMTRLYEVADDFKSISGFFKETFGAAETQEAINDIIRNLRHLTESLSEIAERDTNVIDRILNDLSELIILVKGIAEESSGPMKSVLTDLQEVTRELNTITRENRGPIKDTVANMQELSKGLREDAPKVLSKVNRIIDRLDRGEGTMGKLMTEEGFYEKLDSTLGGINKFVTAAEKFRLNVGFRGEYLFEDDSTKGYFSLKLQPRKDKYYLLELVDDPKGRVKVTDLDVTTTPGATVITHEVRRDEKLKFSALFARQFGNLVLRGGLMEDSFGIGAEYHLRGEDIKASIDAWAFDGEVDAENPHLKFTASYTVFKSLFINIGVDDFINRGRSSPFAGAGLSFDDEDLKYLLTRMPIPLP